MSETKIITAREMYAHTYGVPRGPISDLEWLDRSIMPKIVSAAAKGYWVVFKYNTKNSKNSTLLYRYVNSEYKCLWKNVKNNSLCSSGPCSQKFLIETLEEAGYTVNVDSKLSKGHKIDDTIKYTAKQCITVKWIEFKPKTNPHEKIGTIDDLKEILYAAALEVLKNKMPMNVPSLVSSVTMYTYTVPSDNKREDGITKIIFNIDIINDKVYGHHLLDFGDYNMGSLYMSIETAKKIIALS